MKLFSYLTLLCAMFIASARADGAELVMFEQAGCSWCRVFDRVVAPIYAKSEEGLCAPLRRVDLQKPLPTDLSFIKIERLTPLFVLIDQGREIGRIRGYPGVDGFWMQIAVLFGKVRTAEATARHTRLRRNTMCVKG